jgi:transcription antitermination factor NusG
VSSDNENIKWYVLFASNGKAAKISNYLKQTDVEHFFPLCYKERRIRNSERSASVLRPLIGNLVFVKSSKECLSPHLREIKFRFNITDELYYRDLSTRKIIEIRNADMQHFIAIAGCTKERIIYLSNEDVNLSKGTRIRVIGGVFVGLEGIFLRLKGKLRVVVSLPNLLSVATTSIPTRFIVSLE